MAKKQKKSKKNDGKKAAEAKNLGRGRIQVRSRGRYGTIGSHSRE